MLILNSLPRLQLKASDALSLRLDCGEAEAEHFGISAKARDTAAWYVEFSGASWFMYITNHGYETVVMALLGF